MSSFTDDNDFRIEHMSQDQMILCFNYRHKWGGALI